ncbi:MAG: short-subunit dehydrogenase [Granulosicoccus sp.]|jgi:short-subunit dehydrogenase
MQLQGKTAVITGATTGIGRAIAERFIKEGIEELIITGQDESRLRAAKEDLSTSNVSVNAISYRP